MRLGNTGLFLLIICFFGILATVYFLTGFVGLYLDFLFNFSFTLVSMHYVFMQSNDYRIVLKA